MISQEERIVSLQHSVSDLTKRLEMAEKQITRINDANAIMTKRILAALETKRTA